MKKNFISVIIPLFNKKEYIYRAISSVLSQKYENYEIIIINDGSTDGSENVVKSIINDKITLINQKNLGVSAARNSSLRFAKYDFIAFLDADDEWDPLFLETINVLINNYPDCGIFATNNFFIYPNGTKRILDLNKIFNGKVTGIIENYFKIFSEKKISPFSNSNVCYPKKVFSEMGGYKVGVKLTEDSDLWCRIAFKYKIAYSIKPLAFYYLGATNNTSKIFYDKEYEVSKTLKRFLVNSNIKQEERKYIKKLISFQKISQIKRALIVGEKKYVFQKIFSFSIFKDYPLEYLKIILALFIPTYYLNKLNSNA